MFEGDIDGLDPDDGLVDHELVLAEVDLGLGDNEHNQVGDNLTLDDRDRAFEHAYVGLADDELLGLSVNGALNYCDFAAWGMIMDYETLKLAGPTSILGFLRLTVGLRQDRAFLNLEGDW